jgi:hypothetical protein
MRYKNPTPNPLPASDEGAKMYLIRAETAVLKVRKVWKNSENAIGNLLAIKQIKLISLFCHFP